MIYIIIAILGLLLIVALFTFFFKSDKEEEITAPPSDCCGAHEICEKGLKMIDEKIEYFDDEELDTYKGIPSHLYNDNQINNFREILYTIHSEEISDWLISLEKREIQLPDILKQELV